MKIQGRKPAAMGGIGPMQMPTTQEASANEAAAPTSDQVQIGAAHDLRKLNEAVATLPSVRTEKMEGIRDAIEEGSYHVESEKLARRVVDEALKDALSRNGAAA